jgi:hypothetical protein
MRFVALGVLLLSLAGIAPAVQAADIENRCAYLEADGTCICALPQEWGQAGVVGRLDGISGDVMVTAPAGFSTAPAQDGTIALGDPSTVIVPANGAANLTMGQCYKPLPTNVTVYVDKKGDNCECAHVVNRGAIPWWPVAIAGVVILTTIPGNPTTPP